MMMIRALMGFNDEVDCSCVVPLSRVPSDVFAGVDSTFDIYCVLRVVLLEAKSPERSTFWGKRS